MKINMLKAQMGQPVPSQEARESKGSKGQNLLEWKGRPGRWEGTGNATAYILAYFDDLMFVAPER